MLNHRGDARAAVDDHIGSTPTAPSTNASWRLRLFARMWACAALFHLAGNAREALTSSPVFAAASAALAVGAAMTLLAPHRRRWLMLLCAAVPVTAWYEAPVVGNHWVLASAISLALVLTPVAARSTGRTSDVDVMWTLFAPAARATLLVAYGFAAFAKLNSDFFDPAVSCAVYYHNQLVGSWGLEMLQVAIGAPVGRGLALAAAVTEICVALGLALPRTRRAALVLATSFHLMLAMDLAQHFWDFSAVLFAAFLLFLDDGQVTRLRGWAHVARHRAVVRPALLRSSVVSLSAVVAGLAVLPVPQGLDVGLVLLGHLAWWAYGTTIVLLVLFLFRAPRACAASPRVSPGLLYLVPALVLLNGLTPYLEVKTGFGWNMYSNLRTVAGQSNHFLVPATLDLTGAQRDQVRIVESSDAGLRRLTSDGYVLAYSEFREFAQTHPDVSATYERSGRVTHVDRLADDPALQGSPGAVAQRLQSFRVIDVSGSERCQPYYSPAR